MSESEFDWRSPSKGSDRLEKSAGAVLDDAVARAVDSFRQENPGWDTPIAPNRIHDARVAMRRLRSFLRTFGALYERGFASSVRADLRWYASLLGELRDLDVLEERIAQTSMHEAISARLQKERADALAALHTGRESDRFLLVLSHLETLTSSPPHTARADTPARGELVSLMSRPWRDLREAQKLVRKKPSEVHLHRLRIRAKELRYAAELTAAVAGKDADRLARSARTVQDRIGTHRDALRTIAFVNEVESSESTWWEISELIVGVERARAHKALLSLEKDLRRVRHQWHDLRRSR